MERGNLLVAETTARQMGRLSLDERLQLTALICLKQPDRGRRVAAAWLHRWLDETDGAAIEDAVLIASLLSALGGPHHARAFSTLRDVTRKASSGSKASALRSG
jgi:hypothetical protein